MPTVLNGQLALDELIQRGSCRKEETDHGGSNGNEQGREKYGETQASKQSRKRKGELERVFVYN